MRDIQTILPALWPTGASHISKYLPRQLDSLSSGKDWRKTALEPSQKRPYQVLLTAVIAADTQGMILGFAVSNSKDVCRSILITDIRSAQGPSSSDSWESPEAADFRGGQLLPKITEQD